jgi:nucleotide-binding universal stress UspA family protein
LLLVGPSCAAEWDLPDPVLLLAGIDGSELSQEAARAAGALARWIDGRVRAIEVLRPSDVVVIGGKFPVAEVEVLEGIVAELADRHVAAEYELLDDHDAADRLTREAAVRRAAVIAVASHGRSGLGRLILGSVAMRVVRHATCPVLVTGPKAQSANVAQHGL